MKCVTMSIDFSVQPMRENGQNILRLIFGKWEERGGYENGGYPLVLCIATRKVTRTLIKL